MSQHHLHSIWYYPIKGFPGLELQKTEIDRQGVPNDRRWGITDGERDLGQPNDWLPARTFQRLFIRDDLTRYPVLHENKQTAEAHGYSLGSDRQIDRETGGYWDYPDAVISLINLASLRELEASCGEELDLRRFRANLYLDGGQAWEEFNWIGRKIRIGEATMEILRPIDRCRATSVNPEEGGQDVNVPRSLMGHHGHIFMGVYARVLEPGHIQSDGILEIGEAAELAPSFMDLQPENAPRPSQWPRKAEVIEVRQESEEIKSILLKDPYGGLRPEITAGAYLKLHLKDDEGAYWRCYSLSGWEGDKVRISVKREAKPARASNWIHNHIRDGDEIMISGPYADQPDLIDIPRQKRILVLSAGVGITFSLSLIKRQQETALHQMDLVHVAKKERDLAHWQEVKENASVSSRLYLTAQQDPTDLGHAKGRPDWTEILDSLETDAKSLEVYICGPIRFMEEAVEALMSFGLSDQHIHRDLFLSPISNEPNPDIELLEGPFEVSLKQSDKSLTWRPADGNLLELLESHGISIPSGCRSGACQSCRQQAKSGDTLHLMEPAIPLGEGEFLACCAVPASDLELDL